MQLQNLAALAAAASAAQNTPSGTNALTTSSSPLSVLTSSGKCAVGTSVPLCASGRIAKERYAILESSKHPFPKGSDHEQYIFKCHFSDLRDTS